MNRKAKGSRRERQCKAELEKDGYLVTKAGASLGAFDIIGVSTCDKRLSESGDYKTGHLRLIQVKSNRITKKERESLKTLKLPLTLWLTKEIWIYKDGGKIEKLFLD